MTKHQLSKKIETFGSVSSVFVGKAQKLRHNVDPISSRDKECIDVLMQAFLLREAMSSFIDALMHEMG